MIYHGEEIRMNNSKKILSNIFGVIATFIIVIASAWIFVYFSNLFRLDNTAEAPTSETPPQIEEPQGTSTEYSKLQLLSEPFTPPQNVYSDIDIYLDSTIKLALDGEFSDVKLVVEGKIDDKEVKFVSVNIGTESGTLNAVRENADSLNIKQSKEKGGIFENNINFTLDFFSDTSFATTKNEFQLTRQKTKIIRLWDLIYPSPPSIVRVLVAPFNERGEYGNAEVASLELKYLCKEGKECSAAVCKADSLFTSCLKDNFGIEAAEEWCDITNMEGCENL